jgi:uncharacterized membrane protein YdfJ with MMPL/SSD domain
MIVTRRDPWTVRVAAFCARHPWPVIALWLLVTIGTFVLGLAAGGARTEDAVSQDTRAKFESIRAYDLFGAVRAVAPSQSVLVVVSNPTGTVDDPRFATAIRDMVARLGAIHATVNGADSAVFDQVVDPLTAPPDQGLVSPDRSTVRISARAPGEGDEIRQRLEPVEAAIDQIRAAHSNLDIHAISNFIANQQISRVVNQDLDGSLRLTIPITFAILLIAFGAFAAALVPLALAITALLAAFGLLGLYSQLISPVSPYASQLIVLIGLAVAVDYSLFMISRFRAEQRRGRDRATAIRIASGTAGRAVFLSGLAVMISIGGIFLLDDPLFRSMAIGTIAVVAISVVGSLSILPAILSLLGPRIDFGRVPFFGRSREEGSGIWSVVVRAVMRRPVVAFLVSGGLLLAIAAPVTHLRLGQTDLSSFPRSIDSVRAVQLMNAKWPAGSTLELQVVVTTADEPATQTAISRLSEAVLAIPGVSRPTNRVTSSTGTSALLSFTLAGNENDQANCDIVQRVRHETVAVDFTRLAPSGAQALVTGDAAYAFDRSQFYADGMKQVFAFVLALSFVLLLVAFRSIVIPIKAILLNLLSAGAAYGILVLVFQDGWFNDQLGISPGVIEAFVPVFVFTILFGLSMDYHVFILTRVKEARDRGATSDEAVARGISVTAGTVTSAAAIMVAVFGVFVTLQLVIIKQLGLGLAVAVFLDATIIRSLLLPASMRLLGDWNWWLPPFLRWLPPVTIEVDEDVLETGQRAPTTHGLEPSLPAAGRAISQGASAPSRRLGRPTSPWADRMPS